MGNSKETAHLLDLAWQSVRKHYVKINRACSFRRFCMGRAEFTGMTIFFIKTKMQFIIVSYIVLFIFAFLFIVNL